jgi:Flp pilus assembly protein TadB
LNPFSAIPDQLELPIIGALTFLAILVLGLVIFAPLIDYTRHRRRMAQVDQFGLPGLLPPAPPASSGNPLANAALAVSAQLVRSSGAESDIAARLDKAGMRLRPNQWVLWRILFCVLGIGLFVLLLGPIFGVLIGFLVGFGGTAMYRRIRTERRYQAFANQLPDSLQLVVGSLRAGFALNQALDAMVHEAPEPIATEFSRALAEIRLGADLEDALSRLANRMRSRDLAWVVIAVRIQREVGGNLAEVVTTNMETIRERESLRRHVRALSAEGRMSAYIIGSLPLIIIVLMLTIRRAYILPLFTTAPGLILLTVAGILVTLGSLWMWRLVKVEV